MDNDASLNLWSQVKGTFHHLIYSAKKLLYPSEDASPSQTIPIVFLSKTYSPDSKDFIMDFYTRPWMTYRSGFPPIHGYSSDVGWGCMLRFSHLFYCIYIFLHG